jgi:hypothetical protein
MQVSHWFPIVSDGHALRYPGDAQFTLTATSIRLELTTNSSTVRIAAPGRRLSVSGRTHVYQVENARDFAFGASPSYRAIAGSAAGVTIEAWYTTGDASAALASAKAALVRFESAFGQYQWSRYVLAQTGRAASGNEYPGIVFLGGPMFRDREVVAHETAHQWWYAMAGNDQLRAPWLDEGISEFAAAYWFGSIHSYSSSKPIDSPISAFPNLPAPTTSGDPGSYDQTIYFKSAAFLDSLRSRMGNTAFFAGMREFFAMNRNKIMTTREFYDVMARHGASTAYMDRFITFPGCRPVKVGTFVDAGSMRQPHHRRAGPGSFRHGMDGSRLVRAAARELRVRPMRQAWHRRLSFPPGMTEVTRSGGTAWHVRGDGRTMDADSCAASSGWCSAASGRSWGSSCSSSVVRPSLPIGTSRPAPARPRASS